MLGGHGDIFGCAHTRVPFEAIRYLRSCLTRVRKIHSDQGCVLVDAGAHVAGADGAGFHPEVGALQARREGQPHDGVLGRAVGALIDWGSKPVADEVLMMWPDPCLTMIG